MAYTIKGLAKANDCESLDCYGLANLWQYWYDCNQNNYGRNHIRNDFKLLRKADRQEMLNFLRVYDSEYSAVLNAIISDIY